MDLSKVATERLVKELRNREGVKELIARPYEMFRTSIVEKEEHEIGPAIILVVTD